MVLLLTQVSSLPAGLKNSVSLRYVNCRGEPIEFTFSCPMLVMRTIYILYIALNNYRSFESPTSILKLSPGRSVSEVS